MSAAVLQPGADVLAFVRRDPGDGLNELQLMLEGVHCGACVRRIERALARQGDLETARVNLTTRRLTLRWPGEPARAGALVGTVTKLGYGAVPFDPERLASLDGRGERELLLAMGVAGFAAANVMLLAVSVWAGHAQGMGEATRGFLHWFQALIALPAIVFAGRPFFRSALAALRAGHANMDVPISLAVLLAPAMSLAETVRGGEHAYFDSAITLLFFLLVGRYLDARARGAARAAGARLLALNAGSVTVLLPDGTTRSMRPEAVEAGQTVLVAAGERLGVDGTVSEGSSELDTSLITGETLPRPALPGEPVFAGTLNIAAPLRVTVSSAGEGTLLAGIVRLMEAAEQRRGRFVALADRVARLYAPVVHTLALATFLGWWLVMGAPWQEALMTAVAVLIITCPCALGLAVPAVQVIAAGRLMRRGTLLKSGTALERFARVDTVVFDKTGTLTLGRLELQGEGVDPEALAAAAAMAASSRHPLARALAAACPDARPVPGVRELPGLGLVRDAADGEWRLGRRGWAAQAPEDGVPGAELWLGRPGRAPVRFRFADQLRPDAREVLAALRARGLAVELLSGDRVATVAELAVELGIADWRAGLTPAQKVERLEELAAGGRRVLMVGDGLNDAPSLAAAYASLSPSSAVDISQTAADAVFQGEALEPVLELLELARRAERHVLQNFALSFGYNLLTVPLAVLGFVTPLVAAIAMSSSSLLVVGNALRLGLAGRRGRT
ncbi:heavy metal translocating P-type ATPase [Geminicoccaceae bacterium 1502E]|nr:heavy metal translocating P-type ATPase [Geminicoccaceae bacterium 1502E]